jgi:hypothetical protein
MLNFNEDCRPTLRVCDVYIYVRRFYFLRKWQCSSWASYTVRFIPDRYEYKFIFAGQILMQTSSTTFQQNFISSFENETFSWRDGLLFLITIPSNEWKF